MPQYNNILDLIGEGIRETNPIYRQKMQQQREQEAENARLTQQQLFQKQQNDTNRSTLTEFERQNLASQNAARQDAQDRWIGEHIANGDIVQKDEQPTNIPLPPGNVSGSVLNRPAQTGPGDNLTNSQGGAGGNGAQGALTPTSAAATATPGSAVAPSGSGPSAPSIASLLLPSNQPQGPLSGAVGGAPAGNTSANTQQSRSSSAQTGPLAQINQGSVNPSETASGQTGMDSGALPPTAGMSPAQKMINPQSAHQGFEDEMDRRGLRWATPEEKAAKTATIARQQAEQDRQIKLQQSAKDINDLTAADPDFYKNNPNAIALLRAQGRGYKLPDETESKAMGELYSEATAAYKNGNKVLGDQLSVLAERLKQKPQEPPQTQMINNKGETALAVPGRVFPPGEGWHPINQNQNIGPAAGTTMMVPDGKGGFVAQLVKPGDTVAPGSRTASQVGPTTASRTMTEQAALVAPQVKRVMDEVQAQRDQLGMAMGRANGFFVNKMGVDAPKFAGLDSDLDFAASALLRPHFGGRIPVNVLDDMKKHLQESQSPDDLIARLQAYKTWLDGYAGNGRVPGYISDPIGDAFKQAPVNSGGNAPVAPGKPVQPKTIKKYNPATGKLE